MYFFLMTKKCLFHKAFIGNISISKKTTGGRAIPKEQGKKRKKKVVFKKRLLYSTK